VHVRYWFGKANFRNDLLPRMLQRLSARFGNQLPRLLDTPYNAIKLPMRGPALEPAAFYTNATNPPSCFIHDILNIFRQPWRPCRQFRKPRISFCNAVTFDLGFALCNVGNIEITVIASKIKQVP
jgi:hypothetical protein